MDRQLKDKLTFFFVFITIAVVMGFVAQLAGCSKSATMPVPEVCAALGVILSDPYDRPVVPDIDECERCWGKGKIPFEDTTRVVTCPDCNGAGKATHAEVEDALDVDSEHSGASTTSPSIAITPPAAVEPPAIPIASLTDGSSLAGSIQWVSHAEAQRRSRAGEMVIVYLYGDGCPKCVKMSRYVFTDQLVIEASKGFVMCRLKNVGQEWGIRYYPTFVVLSPGWTIRDRVQIPATVESFLWFLESSL